MAGKVAKCVILLLIFLTKETLENLQDDIAERINGTERSLSRKRRYLVFPEGSSLQLVFCLTIPSVGMGQIFTIGSTVALAWELPHDPFVPFRRPSELLHRVDKPSKHKSGGWTLQNIKSPTPVAYVKTYYNPFLVNKPPAVGYSTIKGYSKLSGVNPGVTVLYSRKKNQGKIENKKYNQFGLTSRAESTYSSQQFRNKNKNKPVTTYLHPVYHRVFRRTRRDLYTKIEKLFTGLSKDGKACLLKAVCEVSKTSAERGTFMEEIIKAIFRPRHHEDEGQEDRDEYDLAANKQHNCTDMYPTCEHSVWHDMFSFS